METLSHSLPVIYTILGGLVALTIKIVFDWLKKPKSMQNTELMNYIRCPMDRANSIADIKWLKDVHDKNDNDGMPLWYMPRGLEDIMRKVAEATNKQTVLLEKMIGILTANGVRLDTLIKNGNGKK